MNARVSPQTINIGAGTHSLLTILVEDRLRTSHFIPSPNFPPFKFPPFRGIIAPILTLAVQVRVRGPKRRSVSGACNTPPAQWALFLFADGKPARSLLMVFARRSIFTDAYVTVRAMLEANLMNRFIDTEGFKRTQRGPTAQLRRLDTMRLESHGNPARRGNVDRLDHP